MIEGDAAIVLWFYISKTMILSNALVLVIEWTMDFGSW